MPDSAASLLSRLCSSYRRHARTFRREARRGIWFAVHVGIGR